MDKDHYTDSYNAACRYVSEVKAGILAFIRSDLADIKDGEALNDRLCEEIDGSEAVIYTGRSWVYLTGSQNDEAMEEELDKLATDVSQRCYWAIRADVMETGEWDDMLEAVETSTVAEYLARTDGAA